ncbi:class I SAM-dependent methyltransferase [Halorubellus sp. JP-L1]|uniref:class I SAM-dependent methyltransferase n=1 Tax=Halorubellus sp. JP-L1 TaxID=2715753 RepID=UPI00140E4E20|nr:methyltransferase domain-containing protein [Halorubellus sp. JP-L1]NHN42453.1 class I SAM-dependent methyltransferase [Halorubellus sp. JP-L1]
MDDDRADSKAAARHAWSTGRYPSLAPNLLPAIARLVNAAGVDPGDDVLDVGCGTGNVALTASQAGARVVGVDLSRRMLELARASADVEGAVDVSFLEGDAEHLPFRDDAFEATLSNFGHVFAPNPAAAGRQLARVTQSGGRVAFTAWSPDGVVGDLTDVLTGYVDGREADATSHLQWGDPDFVREHVPGVADFSFARRFARFRYVSPEHFWREFAEESGPLSPVLGGLADDDARERLREEAVGVLEDWFADNVVRVEYLQVRAVVE